MDDKQPIGRTRGEKARLVWKVAFPKKPRPNDETAAKLGQDILEAVRWCKRSFPDRRLLQRIESDMRKHKSALAKSPMTAAYLESRLPEVANIEHFHGWWNLVWIPAGVNL